MVFPKEKISTCIKETGNWSKIHAEHKFDHKGFSQEQVLTDMPVSAPKLKALVDKIRELDQQDLERHGRLFKHFIYSDIKSSYGAKLIASALYASGFEHAYHVAKTQRGMSFQLKNDLLEKGTGNVFATLTSVSFFEKNIGINFRKDLLRVFNSRPDNIYGDKIRIIILDSGFREGVDLFDVKYAHLFEPIITLADEKQAIGRVTRYCGQKGLEFDTLEGWPVHVYRYETVIPKSIQKVLAVQYPDIVPNDTFFKVFLKFSNIDPKKITFANELEKVSIRGAVDYELTRNIHDFRMGPEKVVSGGKADAGSRFKRFQESVFEKYKRFTWPPIRVENGCTGAPIAFSIAQDSRSETSNDSENTVFVSARSSLSGGGPEVRRSNILPFTPTQDFIRTYFTPRCKQHGILLWHSVGTGKTCTAIATASSSFEREDYTVIYVTRHTLKGDVWKNMFDQVCSSILQEKINNGIELPEAHAQRLRLLEGKWLEPMSYRQFSNMLDGKSKLYDDLVKRNGKKDPLHKTLVIIDEVHKMFAPDVAGSEKPDMDVIMKAFDHSMAVSGKDGVRMLFMTATPYTSNPMDLVRILNLLRRPDDKLPEDFEDFSRVYLDTSGEFSEEGKLRYWDDITGYISYLNRERDIRTFSYAVLHEVEVPMTNYEFDSMIQDVVYLDALVLDRTRKLMYAKGNMTQDIKVLRGKLDKKYLALVENHLKQFSECINDKKKNMEHARKTAEMVYQEEFSACKALEKQCIDDLKKIYKDAVKSQKALAITARKECKNDKKCIQRVNRTTQDAIDDLKEDLEYDVADCKTRQDIQRCLKAVKDMYEADIKSIQESLKYCDEIKRIGKEVESRALEENKRKVESLKDELDRNIAIDEKLLRELRETWKELHNDFQKEIEGDRSQRRRLENCLGSTPAFKRIIERDRALLDIEVSSGPEMDDKTADQIATSLEQQGVLHNVYLINGHGSETVESFARRFRMPKDKVLIVFPVCARSNYMNNACDFVSEFEKPENKELFMDPIRNSRRITTLIKQPFRIYLPGDKVPNLSTNLFLNFEKGKTVLFKSGVYRMGGIPAIDRARLPLASQNLGNDLCESYIGQIDSPMYYNRSVHYEVYKGNIFEPVKTKQSYSIMEHQNYSLQDIMHQVGPGIYYYIGCRSSHQYVQPDIYEKIFIASEAQQDEQSREKHAKEIRKLAVRKKGLHKPTPVSEKPPSILTPTPKREEKPVDERLKTGDKDPKDAKKTKKGSEDNTKEEKADLLQIMTVITTWQEALFSSDEIAPESFNMLDDLIVSWRERLDAMKQTKRVQDVNLELEILADMRSHKNKATVTYSIHVEKREVDNVNIAFKAIYKGLAYKYKKHTRHLGTELVGLIPSKAKDASQKCTADILAKRVVHILREGQHIALPIEASMWGRGDASGQLFASLCEESKRIWRSRPKSV